jgi:uncharacterized OB-fold protein
MAPKPSPLLVPLFCERCGTEFEPSHRRCADCRAAPTRDWLQAMSLAMLLTAIIGNSAVACWVLPRLEHARRGAELFRAWRWCDVQAATYGWAPIVAALLTWHFSVWRRAKLREKRAKFKRWLAKKVLVFVAAAAAAPLLPWWLPVGAPPHEFWTILARLRVPAAVCAWGAVAFVLALLCAHRGTRDALLGHGKVLSLVSLGILCAVLAATLVGWSLA